MRIPLFLAVLLSASTAVSQPKQVPFSADIIQSGHPAMGQMQGKIYMSDAKMRMEIAGMVTLVDLKTMESWLLSPEKKTAMKLPASAQGQQSVRPTAGNPCANNKEATCKDLGVEKIDGRETHKWQITHPKLGTSTTWIDVKLSFPLRTEMAQGLKMELKNIKEGAPDPSLLEVPKDYALQAMPALPGMSGAQQPGL